MSNTKIKIGHRAQRHKRVRAKIRGSKEKPRLSVFRSNKGLYLQLIDDDTGVTLVSADSKEIKKVVSKDKQGKKEALSFALGKLIANKAKDKKIKEVVFDRGGYKYHGRVKAVADGAREEGLKF